MKKILLGVVIAVAAVLVIGAVLATVYLDQVVKRAVETVGPRLTQVTVQLDNVKLSPFSGAGDLEGLRIGNPQGYETPHAITAGRASIVLQPRTLLAEKVVIEKIELVQPDITFEGNFSGNNLSKILANVNEATGGADTNAVPEAEAATRKLQVNNFLISGARLNVSIVGMRGQSVAVAIPEIHLRDLGTGDEGITAPELVKKVLAAIEQRALEAANAAIADLGKKGAARLSEELEKSAGEKISKGVGDLLKKK
jgi:hypothetical protein